MTDAPPIITEAPHPHLHAVLADWYKAWGTYALELAAYHAAKNENDEQYLPIPEPPQLSAHPMVNS